MAEFRIDQATPGAGIAGRSRHDLIPGEVISLEAVSPTPGAGVSFAWELLDKVGSTAALTAATGTAVDIGPDSQITGMGGFRIQLTADDNGIITRTVRLATVRSPATGLRPPLFPEGSSPSGSLAAHDHDLSEDNALYLDRGGLGSAEQNWRGWAESYWELLKYLESSGGLRLSSVVHVASVTASRGELIRYDDSAAGVQIDAPASPVFGDTFGVKEVAGTGLNVVTISGNGVNIQSVSPEAYVPNFGYGVAFGCLIYRFDGTKWILTNG